MFDFGFFVPPDLPQSQKDQYNFGFTTSNVCLDYLKFSTIKKNLTEKSKQQITNDGFSKKITQLRADSTIDNLVIDIRLLRSFCDIEGCDLGKNNKKTFTSMQKEAIQILKEIESSPTYRPKKALKFFDYQITDSLSSFPAELQYKIFDYLELKELYALRLTSRYWYDFSRDVPIKSNFIRLGPNFALQISKLEKNPSFQDLEQFYTNSKNGKRKFFFQRLSKLKKAEPLNYSKLLANCNQLNDHSEEQKSTIPHHQPSTI